MIKGIAVQANKLSGKKFIFFANTDWYLFNFRLSLAKSLAEQGVDVVFLSPPGPYGTRLENEGFRWIKLAMIRRSINPFRETKLLIEIISVYLRERPDLVHHFTIKCVIYGSIAARLLCITRRINAITGLGYVYTNKNWLARILKQISNVLLNFSLRGERSRVVVQNADDMDFLMSYHLASSQQIVLIPGSGVSTERFRPKIPFLERSNTRVLLATRLLWDKGVAEYVSAARTVHASDYDVTFLLAGASDPGNPAAVPPDQILIWAKEGTVVPLGHVEDMQALLSDVDIVVLPSYREGLPRNLLEGASCGLPIVCTDVPGCREVVTHGINGLLVPARDSQFLAEAIMYLIDHPEVRRSMGREGRKIAVSEFDEKIIIERTIDIYLKSFSDKAVVS